MPEFRPILAIDFDGCCHGYSRGWQQGRIYDPVVPGFFDWAMQASAHFTLTIYSSRSNSQAGIDDMRSWMAAQWVEGCVKDGVEPLTDSGSDNNLKLSYSGAPHVIEFQFAHQKPPAWLTIDDRAIVFQGNWSDRALAPAAMLAFKPWTAARD